MTDTSKEPPELLPCPFCGGDAGDTYYQLGWFISCKHCSASTEVTNAKARAVEAWNRRAPAVPVPQFNHTAKRKLNILLGAGEEITGYAFQNKDGRRGSIDCHGFVAWWHDAAAPQPPESISHTVLETNVAAPVQMPEPVAFALEWTFNGEERGIRLYDDERHCRFDAESDGGVCHPLYTEQQVRQLLADHGIQEQST